MPHFRFTSSIVSNAAAVVEIAVAVTEAILIPSLSLDAHKIIVEIKGHTMVNIVNI